MQPAARQAFGNLVAQGWVDALREQQPQKRVYTFWSYWRNRFAIVSAGVDREVRTAEGASDHALGYVELDRASIGRFTAP